MEKTEIIILYFVAVNVLTLCVYGIDKIKAMRGGRRISEATLLLLAVSGGSIGAMLAMIGSITKQSIGNLSMASPPSL